MKLYNIFVLHSFIDILLSVVNLSDFNKKFMNLYNLKITM